MIALATLAPLVVPVIGIAANYLLKNFNELEMNKWTIAYAVICNAIFYGLFGKLDSWFAFPEIIKFGLSSLFQLYNCNWVISNWQAVPNKISTEGIGLKVGTCS